MKYKEMLEGLELIHCAAQEVGQVIKHNPENKELLNDFLDDLFSIIETVREPLFDLVHSGKIDK